MKDSVISEIIVLDNMVSISCAQVQLFCQKLENLIEKEKKIQDKLVGFQELYDKNQKMLSLGRKTNELFNKYLQTNNKKELRLLQKSKNLFI